MSIPTKHYGFGEFLTELGQWHKHNGQFYGVSNQHATVNDSWDLGVSPTRALKCALDGDMSMVAPYESALSHIESSAEVSTRLAWSPHVSGSRVCVPSYLAGSPMNMRRRVPREVSTRSVRIFVCAMASAGVDAATLLKRGSAILGLVAHLQRMQIATEVIMFQHSEGCERASGWGEPEGTYDFLQTIRLDTQPFSLSSVGFAIAHPAFMRNGMWQVAYRNFKMTNCGFAKGYQDTNFGRDAVKLDRYYAEVRTLLNADPIDIIIRAAGMGDPMVRNPLAWVEETIKNMARPSEA